MTVQALLRRLRERGIELARSPNSDKLRVRAPQGALDDALREALQTHKAELLAALASSELSARERSPGPQDFPMSAAQRRLWFQAQLEPTSAVYNNFFAIRSSAPFEPVKLEACLRALHARHEILRTVYLLEGLEPVQRILPALEISLPMHDLSQLPAAQREAELARLESTHKHTVFDLSRGPVLRCALVVLGAADQRLLVVQHHIATDGRTTELFVSELFARYAGEPYNAPEPALQYADYASWEQARLRSSELDAQRTFWCEQLQGLPLLELPADYQRGQHGTDRGGMLARQISPELTARLEALAKREGCSLFVLLMAAFSACLQRYSGQNDFGLGVIADGRTRAALQDVWGVFINTLVVRCDLSGEPTFRAHLQRTRERFLDALDHQDLPYDEVVRLWGRGQQGEPVRVCMVFESRATLGDAPQAGGAISAYADSVDSSVAGTAKFDIYIALAPSADGILASLQYRSDVFAPEFVLALAQHFEALLGAAVEQPLAALSELDRRCAADREQPARFVRGPDLSVPGENLAQAFQAQVQRTPNATALAAGGVRLSYRELDQRANQLAHALIARGVARGDCVGILLARNEWLVIAVLAIHKAGAAYLPLDPNYPVPRLQFMLDDSGVRCVVTAQSELARVERWSGTSVFVDQPLDDLPSHDPGLAISADQLAYVIYTSGSTGTPKGVLIEQRNVLNFYAAMDTVFGDEPAGTWLAVTTLSFDISVLELLWTLARGFKVVLYASSMPDASLRKLVAEQQVTHLQCTPSFVHMLLADQAGREALGALQHLLVGGEAFPAGLAAAVRGVVRGHVTNMYGPTETTVWSTCHRLQASDTRVPIGAPFVNTQLYVLDPSGAPVPQGAVGELFIAGAGVVRGYHARPELTAQRFVRDMFAADPNARMYRTGDLVRLRANGELDYIGRTDQQVKFHGHRIELGEIEAALSLLPAVGECAVAVQGDSPEAKTLVAYVQLREPLAHSALRSHLANKLPEYMLPARYAELEALPRTPNGKLDRAALPWPLASAAPETRTAPAAVGGQHQQLVAAIWCQVLERTQIDPHQGFFEAGGHSLLAVRVHRLLCDALGRELPLAKLFEHPTIASFAQYLDGATGATPAPARSVPAASSGEIAIVGMAGRFPGAADVDAFWRMLCAGEEGIRQFETDELLAAGVAPEALRSPHYVRAKGYLEGADLFDAGYFDVSARDASLLDPQQRIFLECAVHALEHAGYDTRRCAGPVGVFGTSAMSSYMMNAIGDSDIYRAFIHNDKDFLATRVAYKLDLSGPALTVQTACSSSLAAVVLACQSLWRGECALALAGGVAVSLPLKSGYEYREGMIFSPDGHCRPFDAHAGGTLAGNGVGIVVLQRLEDALRDRATIHAVIKGAALNNDGAKKVGFTAPSVAGQAEVIGAAQAMAGLSPQSIGYVETHGTATQLGDSIEISALKQVFAGPRPRRCALGAVKSNVGHLDTAAGIAGLIKTVLCLEHAKLPKTVHFEQAHAGLGLEDSPFYVNAELQPWESDGEPRRAGVSSFGIGGTNAHVVLEEPPAQPAGEQHGPFLLAISARTREALDEQRARYAQHLADHPQHAPAAVSFTAALGRRHFTQRCAVLGSSPSELAAALHAWQPSRVQQPLPVRWVFSDWSGLPADDVAALMAEFPAFAAVLHECGDLVRALCQERSELQQPAVGSAASVALEVAFAKLWSSFGLVPELTVASGTGHYAAACVAGDLSLSDALRLAAQPGHSAEREQPQLRGPAIYLELGSTPTLLAELRRNAADSGESLWLQSLWRGRCSRAAVLSAVAQLYEAGCELELGAVVGEQRRVPLPGYPFERKRYWLESAARPQLGAAAAPGTLLGAQLALSGEPIHVAGPLSASRQPMLRDHLVYGAIVVPGAYYVSGLLEIAEQLWGAREGFQLDDLVFHTALAVDSEVDLDTVLAREPSGERSFQVQSRAGDQGWRLHASGRLGPLTAAAPQRDALSAIRARCSGDGPLPVLGTRQASAVTRGPSFEWTRGLLVGQREALLEFHRPPAPHGGTGLLPAGLLDSLWGAILCAVPPSDDPATGAPYLPFSVTRLAVYRAATDVVFGHGVIREWDAQRLRADIRIYSEAGELLAEVEDATLRQAPLDKLLRDGAATRELPGYRTHWQPLPLTAAQRSEHISGNWLVLGEPTALLAALCEKLEREGAVCWRSGSAARDSLTDMRTLVQQVCAADKDITGVIDLLSERADADPAALCAEVQTLVRALLTHERPQAPRLLLVTRGGLAVAPDCGLAPSQLGVAGLARVIPSEHPELRCTQLDLAGAHADALDAILDELHSREGMLELQVAQRHGVRRVARLTRLEAPATNAGVVIRPGASYLVTGGSGALGQRVAQWLIERGATHVVLTARSAGARQLSAALAASSAVEARACDVADAAALAALVSELPGLRGVFHAAGVLRDGALIQQDSADYAAVFAPKAQGVLNLHRATEHCALDHFVLFSSIASVFGSRGQAAYAAANAFLDGFAHYRRQRGLTATTINWGAWAGGGMAAGLEAARHKSPAFDMIDPEAGMRALDASLARDEIQTARVSVRWQPFMSGFAADATPRLFAAWQHLAAKPSEDASGELRQLLLRAQPEQRASLCARYVEAKVRKLLALEAAARIAPDDSLVALGLDSLMAVELRDELVKASGLRLPTTLLFDYPALGQLVPYLLAQLNAAEPDSTPEPAARAHVRPVLQLAYDAGEIALDDAIREVEETYSGLLEEAAQ